jgi:hypothetical protein
MDDIKSEGNIKIYFKCLLPKIQGFYELKYLENIKIEI